MDTGCELPGELEMLRAILVSVPDLIYVKDEHGRFLLASQSTADMVGVASVKELIGKMDSDFDFCSEKAAAAAYQDEQTVLQTGMPSIRQTGPFGEGTEKQRWLLTTTVPFRDSEGRIIGIIGIAKDVSGLKQTESELKRMREDLHYRATRDSLTGLLNRAAMLDMLRRELIRNGRENTARTVLLVDLDHFKKVNDQFGHLAGDEVLREVAGRFLRSAKGYDLVGRLGGEEFLMILGGCGVGYLDQKDVLEEVDKALYAAKDEGRNRCKLGTSPAARSEPFERRRPIQR